MKQKKDRKTLSQEEKSLSSYNSKLKREAVFKSLFLALTVGFLLSAIVSVVSFITLTNILWVALVATAVATVGLTFLFYFKRYRPDIKSTAARVDEVGLEERVITMLQFKDRDDPMLNRQREDAQTALNGVSAKQVKMRFPKILIILLSAFTVCAVFMMSYSTARAVSNENSQTTAQEDLTEEDKIINGLIETLRKEIDSAEIDETFRSQLHGIVDDLEDSLKPTDSLEVKVAKIMDTADKIHKLIEEYLNRATIGEELMKHGTTYELGKAIDSKDVEQIRAAFQMMYDSIEPLVKQMAFDILNQTADDIDASLNAAKNTPPELQKALEDLRDAFRRAFDSLQDAQDALQDAQDALENLQNSLEENQESMSQEEIDQAMQEIEEAQGAVQDKQDAMQDAMQGALDEVQSAVDEAADAMENFFDQQGQEDGKYEGLDEAIQDAVENAMDQLGQDFEYPKDPEENDGDGSGNSENPEDNNKPGESDTEIGGSHPGQDNKETQDTVIDGETSYKDIFENGGYSDDMQNELEGGDLSDEDRQIIQDYFDSLN